MITLLKSPTTVNKGNCNKKNLPIQNLNFNTKPIEDSDDGLSNNYKFRDFNASSFLLQDLLSIYFYKLNKFHPIPTRGYGVPGRD